MLLESIRPVVTSIRCMEEEDGVPLSYPYPVPASAPAPISSSFPCLPLEQHAEIRHENCPSLSLSATHTAHIAGRQTNPAIHPSPIASAEGARTVHVQSGLVSNAYGARVVQSTATEAAFKWKAARLASSKKSLQVNRRWQGSSTAPVTNSKNRRMRE